MENKIYENIMIDVNAVITLSEKRCEKNMQSCQKGVWKTRIANSE